MESMGGAPALTYDGMPLPVNLPDRAVRAFTGSLSLIAPGIVGHARIAR